VRQWLASKLGDGMWFPGFTRGISFLCDHLSLGIRFKRWLGRERVNGNPPGASELYQFIWLCILLIWLAAVDSRVAWSSTSIVRHFAAAIVGYRLLEIALFCLDWVFCSPDEKLHSYRRSIAMLAVNLLEISLVTTLAAALLACGNVTLLDALYSNLSAAFSMSLPSLSEGLACSSIAHSQLIASYLIGFVLLGSLVGQVVRPEKLAPSNHACAPSTDD